MLIFFQQSKAQHTPELTNYSINDYKAHQQNWAINQSHDHWMYFANTDGLLAFNGQQWFKFALPGQKIIRSVLCHNDRIYTGAFGEFGYWTKDACGDHLYHSLADIIPNHCIDKEEIWHIFAVGRDIYFQSFSVLCRYDGQHIYRVHLPGSVMFMHLIGQKKVIQSIDDGLFELIDDDHFRKIEGSDFFIGKTVTGIHLIDPKDDTWLIATATDGVYTFQNGKINIWIPRLHHTFEAAQVNKIHIRSDGSFVIGTIRDGLYILSKDQTLKYHFHAGNGLQNNTILAIFEDKSGDLWLGLDKGIAHIFMSEDILTYKDVAGNLGTVYCLLMADDFLYIGTNQGLYFSHLSHHNLRREFHLIKGTQGQVWQLLDTDQGILCGHNNGTFLIQKDNATKISSITGGWFTMAYGSGYLLQGTYTGLILFKKLNHQWVFSHRIAGYNEPIKKMVSDLHQNIWVTGPNNGLARLSLDKSLSQVLFIKKYEKNDNFQNVDINYLHGDIILNNGVRNFTYSTKQDAFVPNESSADYLVRSIDTLNWAKVYRDSISFYKDKHLVASFPFIVNRDCHSVNLLGQNIVGICMAEGYAIIHLAHQKVSNIRTKPIHFLFKMDGMDDCLTIHDHIPVSFPFHLNSGELHFFTTQYAPFTQYFGRLLPLNEGWKPLPKDGIYPYHHLASGQYTFEMRNASGYIQKVNFVIADPWYKTHWAWMAYFIVLILLMYWLHKFFNVQLDKQKSLLEKENNRLLREKMIEMENERLHQDNILKSKDLANATMHLIQKNELIQEIKDEILQIRKSGEPISQSKDIQQMLHHINENLTIQDDRNLFDANFEDVHADFLKKLKLEFSTLSADDLKLAAYLRMNLSSKEIAPLFNISIRGLENKRYRLRKKMNLSLECNLSEFFQNYL